MAALACAASSLAVTGCQAAGPTPETKPPEMRFEDLHFQAYRDSRLSARGTAAEAVYLRTSGELTVRDVALEIPQEGSSPATLSAPLVEGDVPARTFEARGGLRALRGRDEARTESARYAASDGVVRGERPIEIAGPGYRLTGPSFTLDPRAGELVVRGGVRLSADAAGTGEARP
jgi:hypothetical protein